jgi:hypothetical protein
MMAVPLVVLPLTSPGVGAALPLLALGLCLVVVGLASGLVWPGGAKGHVALNAMLAPGFLLVVTSVLVGTGDVMRSLVALLLCYLWLDARIELAGWNHARVCAACPEDCKAYRL